MSLLEIILLFSPALAAFEILYQQAFQYTKTIQEFSTYVRDLSMKLIVCELHSIYVI